MSKGKTVSFLSLTIAYILMLTFFTADALASPRSSEMKTPMSALIKAITPLWMKTEYTSPNCSHADQG